MRSYFGLILAFIGAVASAQSVTWSPVPANFPLTISNPTTGQCVTYNGTVWVNGSCGTASAVPASGVQAGTLGSGVLLNSASTQTLGQTTIFASDVNPSNSGATNVTNMAAHVTACVAAGGCVIQLGCYSSPIPMANSAAPAIVLGTSATTGTTGADTPYNNVSINGCTWANNASTLRANLGTVLQGTSTTYPLIAYNNTDNTVDYASASVMASSLLTGVNITNLALDTCSYGIKFGALSKSGITYSKITNVYVSNFTSWGFWFENSISTNLSDMYVQSTNTGTTIGTVSSGSGHIFIGSSLGSLLQPGSMSLSRSFTQQTLPNAKERGIVVMARKSAGGVVSAINDVNFRDVVPILGFSGTAATSASVTGSGNNLTFNSGTIGNFPVDTPVFVSDSGSALGLKQYQTYFVIFNNGSYIQLANAENGTVITPSAGTDTIYTIGPPPLELVGYGAGNLVQSSTMMGVDLETLGTCLMLVQNANTVASINNGPSGQGTSSSSLLASSICGRSAQITLSASVPLILDLDTITATQSVFSASLQTDSATVPIVQRPPTLTGEDRQGGSGALYFGATNMPGLYGGALELSQGGGGASWIFPSLALGQRTVYDSYNGNSGWSGYHAGAIVVNAGSGHTRTLPMVTTYVNTTAAPGNAISNAGSPNYVSPTVGLSYEVFCETNSVTISPASGQYFNNNSALTSITCPAGGNVFLRAQSDGSVGYWVVESISGGAYLNGALNEVSSGTFTSTNATGYSLANTSGNITSGTTGFGENWVGTVNDSSAVDGIISYANITCTLCTATSYLADWKVGGTSQFQVDTFGQVFSNSNILAGGAGYFAWNGRESITSPGAGKVQLGGANASTVVNQTLSAQGALAGTALNTAGGNLTIQSGLGTGTGTPSTISLQVPASTGSSSTSQQTAYTELSLTPTTITIGDGTNNPTVVFNTSSTIQAYGWNAQGVPTSVNQVGLLLNATNSGTNQKRWLVENGRIAAGTFDIISETDGGGAGTAAFTATRGATTAVSTVSLGNTTDMPLVNIDGHIASVAGTYLTSSALSSCGTTPAINATATDTKGTITEGTTATGCVLTFAAAYATAPDCTVTSPTGSLLTSYSVSTTALTIVNASATGDKFTYMCIQ